MKKIIIETGLLWRHYSTFKIYVVLICLAFLKQLIHETQLIDGLEYQIAAHNWAATFLADSCQNGTHCEHWLHETRRTMGYPFLIAIAFFIPKIVMLLQVFLAVLIPVFVNRIVELLHLPQLVFRYFLWFFILYPLQYFYTSLLMPELFCQVLLMIGCIAFLKKNWLGLGLCLSALILLKPVFILFIPVLILLAIKKPILRMGLLIPLGIFLLISAFNATRTGKFHFSSMGVENAWEYNTRAVLNVVMTDWERAAYYNKCDSELSKLNFTEKYNWMQIETKRMILPHWKLYSWLHIKGCFLALVDPGRYDLVAFMELNEGQGFMGIKNESKLTQVLQMPWYILVYLIIFLCLNILRWFLLIYTGIRELKTWWKLFLILAIFIAVTGPVGSARYLFPFMPFVCLFSARGLYLFREKNAKNITHQR